MQQPGASGYETRDANVKWIFGIVASVFALGLTMHFTLGWMQGRLQHTPTPADRWTGVQKPSLSYDTATRPRRGFPHLQVVPALDLNEFRAHEEALLNSYGWVNPRAGIVRMPITRAMDLLLERGLPVRSGTNQVKAGPSPYELQLQRPTQRTPTPSDSK